jgi:choline dehydrogenase-like flavoprotein
MTASIDDDITGITFRETMAGGFALGTTDPEVGAKGADELAMHATIRIRDIDAFIADPQHKAELTGTIDFAPMGHGMIADSGVFGLFSPSGNPELTYMVYELGFMQGGKHHYLAGKKHVKLGSPLRLWGETTTLYTTLHQGKDASGKVVGAGILALGVIELFKLLGTLEATDSDSFLESAGAKAKFFRFFSSELTRTYVLHKPDD